MRPKDTLPRFVVLLAVLAVLSSVAAFSSADPSDAEPTTFEANALIGP